MPAPDPTAIRFAIREVTPEDALEWLKRDHRPRRQSQRYVRAYTRDMAERRWQLNGETIIFSVTGKLLDGRKRLRACVESQTSFPTIVVEGVREEDLTTIDALRARTAVDTLYIRREASARTLASVLNIIHRYYRHYQHPEASQPVVISRDTLFILELRPEIRDSIMKTAALSRVGWHSIVAAVHHLASRVDAERADAFFARVADEGTPEGDTATLLRNQMRRSVGSGQERMLALAILAWNAEYLNHPVKTLRWRQEGEHPQRFPTVAGLSPDDAADLDQHRQPNYDIVVDPHELDLRIEDVEPSRAEQLLTANDNNRKSIGRVVEKYMRDMQAGTWALNGQTIKISRTGKLLDGQHRCLAAIEAGKSFRTIVVRGLPDEIFDTLDSGPARSLGEVLGSRGEKNANSLAAALQKFWLYDQNMPTHHAMRASHAELLGVLALNPGIRVSVNFTLYRLHDIVPSGIAGTTHYIAAKTDRAGADYFIERLGDGVGLRLYDPILRFRELMRRDRRNKRNPLREVEKWALMIKAINGHFMGADIKLLVWKPNAREEFPRVLERIPEARSGSLAEPGNA